MMYWTDGRRDSDKSNERVYWGVLIGVVLYFMGHLVHYWTH